MFSIKNNRAVGIGLALGILPIVGISFSDSFIKSGGWAWFVKIVLAAILLIIIGFITIYRDTKVHRLNPGDKKEFADFFTKWYKQEGSLVVYCNDLDWVDSEPLAALRQKASDGQLKLYFNAELCKNCNKVKDLKANNALLYHIPPGNVSNHSFSILTIRGSKEIICRNKDVDGGSKGKSIEFVSANSFSDPHLIALAEDVLRNCPAAT